MKHMNIALILSGGTGTRLGADIPKQYLNVKDRPIISYCMEVLFQHRRIDAVYIVAATEWQELIKEQVHIFDEKRKFKGFSKPGENRQLSIRNGLEDMRSYVKNEDYVLIHDAARPLLTDKLIEDSFNAVVGHDGVLPVLPMKDTVYQSGDGKKTMSLLSRSEIFAGQAPETFVFGKYLDANRSLLPDKIREINGSTEPAILAGLDIVMIPGDEKNLKITTQMDLERFERNKY